jgi:hypothetical protein
VHVVPPPQHRFTFVITAAAPRVLIFSHFKKARAPCGIRKYGDDPTYDRATPSFPTWLFVKKSDREKFEDDLDDVLLFQRSDSG